ncbi:hypothetical protein HK097_011173 [Rhizophlyctis rosea]|uniref:Peptidase S9 prolyl oligopeptidase catalytic domain-containing protein n=1 Tax=Rhizophlyctis rosea TaxID=64517 RepID=A0AAD5SJZ3_9FUNG|nr:hypothetical protein HK097_011173 [Rhizophlyctis rosea]
MPDYDDVTITTPDNVKIKGYLIRKRQKAAATSVDILEASSDIRRRQQDAAKGPVAGYTLLYCHANAGNMHEPPLILRLLQKAALDYITSHPDLKDTRIVVYGQSIGGAVAVALTAANQDRIHALIVENTFTSLRKLIPHVMPYLKWVSPLCHQIWDTESAIQRVTKLPILLLSGGRDELIPPAQMASLCRTARAARRGSSYVADVDEGVEVEKDAEGVRFVVFPNGTHNETCIHEGYFDEVKRFWNEI